MTEFLGKLWELWLLFLRQFAGGPGPPENNLVRFGLPILLWALLMYIAWSRQRTQVIPRERLLLWGFGLGLVRESFMFVTIVIRILNPGEAGSEQGLHQPVEHALAMAAVVVVAGAFLRYILDDEKLSRRYLQVGLGITAACLVVVSFFWLRHQSADPEILFHQTWEAWLFHLPLSILILVAIVFLGRKNGWLRNVIVTALFFFFISEMLIVANYATDRAFNETICPIGNALHILAIPLLGYVYFKEQSIEKKRAEASLSDYRDHLDGLVHLNQASAGLISTLDSELILEEIVSQAAWLINCQAALVCTWATRPQTVEVLAGYGLTAEEKIRLSNPYFLTPLLYDFSRQEHVLAIYDFSLNGRFPTYCKADSLQGNLICRQLRSPQQPETFLLLLDHQEDRVWRAKELELIENFANRATVALINANLHQQMEWTAAVEERQRIAADMHDGLAQIISLLGLKVDHANELLESGATDATMIELSQIRDVVERASLEARRSIASLQDPVQRQYSLQELLTKMVKQFRLEYGANVSFAEMISEPLALPMEQREQVLPVVHEALLNAHRHAHSQQIQLSLECQDDTIKITVLDDGQGFSERRSKKIQSGHFGLSIMRARAARLGGQLMVESTPGQGTRVTLEWPRNVEQQHGFSPVPETSSRQSLPLSSVEVGL